MVIGNGLLAKRFAEYHSNDDVLIFASGVSDSKRADQTAYQREEVLLNETRQQHKHKRLVYFSTCSVYDPSLTNGAYVNHKLAMEALVQQHERYLIFRISNLAGRGGNPKTIVNYLVDTIKQGAYFELWENAFRNIIGIDDAYRFMDFFIQHHLQNATINIANPVSYSTKNIVNVIEDFTGKKGNFKIVSKGQQFFVDTAHLAPVASNLNIDFSGNYLLSILKHYYSSE